MGAIDIDKQIKIVEWGKFQKSHVQSVIKIPIIEPLFALGGKREVLRETLIREMLHVQNLERKGERKFKKKNLKITNKTYKKQPSCLEALES